MNTMFTKASHFTERNLPNTATGLRLPLRNFTDYGQKASLTGVPRCGIASKLNAKKPDHYLSLNPF